MPLSNPFRSAIRNTRRYAEVLEVLVRHGFGSFVQESGLDRLIEKGMLLIGAARESEETRHLSREVRIRRVLEDLGPTFIKLGQILSTRPDLIPPELASELRNLQTACPKVDFESIQKLLNEEFQGKVEEFFESIENEPIATASLAQAHRAVLKNGTTVVLKVLKPGTERRVQTDLDVMREIAQFVENHFKVMGYSPTAVVREFSRQLRKELDFRLEARNTERLHDYFAHNPSINFPRVYQDLTTRRVMTLEEIEGVLLSHADLSLLTAEQRRRVVENGADAVFSMCLEYGFFHADPHPGNIFVLADGSVCFIDCGMTGHVDQKTQWALGDLVAAVVAEDLEKTLKVSLSLVDADPALKSNRSLRLDVWELISRVHSTSISGIDVIALLNGQFELFRKYQIQCPADLVFLIKAITTVQSVAVEIDPEFDLIGYVKPHLRRLATRRYSLKSVGERVVHNILGYLELAEDLPEELRAFAAQLRRRDFSVRLEHNGLDFLTETLGRASRIVAFSLIFSALIVSSSILVLADKTEDGMGTLGKIGIGGIVGALLLALLVLTIAIFRRGKK